MVWPFEVDLVDEIMKKKKTHLARLILDNTILTFGEES